MRHACPATTPAIRPAEHPEKLAKDAAIALESGASECVSGLFSKGFPKNRRGSWWGDLSSGWELHAGSALPQISDRVHPREDVERRICVRFTIRTDPDRRHVEQPDKVRWNDLFPKGVLSGYSVQFPEF